MDSMAKQQHYFLEGEKLSEQIMAASSEAKTDQIRFFSDV
jgi:hypothetical protein